MKKTEIQLIEETPMNKQTKTRNEVKQRAEKLAIAINGHKHRIKEQRKAIKDAKRAIKQHKLLIKQVRIVYKLETL